MPPKRESIRSLHKTNVSPSPSPLQPLISPKPSHTNHGNRTPARRLPAPRDAERPHRPGGDAARSERQPPPAAIQDSLYHRHSLRHPQPAGPRAHRGAECGEGLCLPSELRTTLVENHHSFLIVEYNPQLYERARDMAGNIAQALTQASRGILPYASVLDRHLEAIAAPTGSSASMICMC